MLKETGLIHNERVLVRMSGELKDRATKEAQGLGMSLSSYIRFLIVSDINERQVKSIDKK